MQKLAWKKRKMEEEGEMGVGTLLIFIAMILVAAVAAGVLVQTAYKLQSQAEQTGNEALQEVATGVKVIAAWGEVTDSVITTLHIKIALQAGSPQINLVNLTLEVNNGDFELTLDHEDSGDADGTDEFSAVQLRDTYPYNDWVASADNQGITSGDIVQIDIAIDSLSEDMSLVTQQQMSVLLIPKHGVPTYFSFVAPSVLPNDVVVLK